ncbi:XRE family transcriptional regulator, partial [Providencia rettgeri]|nr:XRE family transcriptional regulator [Providencia rettgeri]
ILFYLEISPSAFFESVSLKINEKHPSANSFIHNSECLSDGKDNYHYIFNRQTEVILNSLYSK